MYKCIRYQWYDWNNTARCIGKSFQILTLKHINKTFEKKKNTKKKRCLYLWYKYSVILRYFTWSDVIYNCKTVVKHRVLFVVGRTIFIYSEFSAWKDTFGCIFIQFEFWHSLVSLCGFNKIYDLTSVGVINCDEKCAKVFVFSDTILTGRDFIFSVEKFLDRKLFLINQEDNFNVIKLYPVWLTYFNPGCIKFLKVSDW